MSRRTVGRRNGRRSTALAGIALAAAHAAALPALVRGCDRPALEVEVNAAPASHEGLKVRARLPDRLAGRVVLEVDGAPAAELASASRDPGLRRVEWSVRYRGGFERRVGVTQLVGPFQAPEAPPCSARILVGQSLLEADLVPLVEREVERGLSGTSQWPIGRFESVADVRARIGRLGDAVPGAARLVPATARAAIIEVALELRFSRARVPIAVVLLPRIAGGRLALEAKVTARVALDSRILQWLSDRLGGDRLASATAGAELRDALDGLMAAPPPIPLGAGRELRVSYCDGGVIEGVPGSHLAVPLAIELAAGPEGILPVRARAAPAGPDLTSPAALPAPPPLPAPLAIELDLDALNAILHRLWATGALADALAGADVEGRFERESVVRELLSVRVRELSLPVPPTLAAGDGAAPLLLGVEAALVLEDGPARVPARLFGRVGFELAPAHPGGAPPELAASLGVSDLSLTCRPGPTSLEPCYADLVAELSRRAPELHGELSRAFADLLDRLFVGRVLGEDPGFVAERVALSSPGGGRVRLELHGRLFPLPAD